MTGNKTMQYRYQVDYGGGFMDVFPDEQEVLLDDEEYPSRWLTSVETEGAVHRARVLLGDEVVEERDFTCSVSQNRVHPDGHTEYSVQCSGGSITVQRRSGGKLTGYAQPGYVGDADIALERAFEAVRKLIEA